MTYRLALIVVQLVAAPVAAQDQEAQDREFEAGGGAWLVNPLGVLDFDRIAAPSANIAWTNWYSERSGWTAGVLALPVFADETTAIFGHVTWRRRWIHGEGNFTHLGVGGGPTLWLHGHPKPERGVSVLYHVEVLTTRRIRDGLSLRAGVTFTPLLHVPIIVQPAVMLVWSR